MKPVFVDTSVWIDYFQGKNPKANALSDLIDHNLVCVNDLILAELVPFIRHTGETRLVDLLDSVQRHPMKIDWTRMIEYQTLNLKKGINKVGLPDLMIVQHIVDYKLVLFSFDKHFELMKELHGYSMLKI